MALAPTGPADFKLFWYIGAHTPQAYSDLAHTADFAKLGTRFGSRDFLPFLYPPTLLLILKPFTWVPLWLAKPLWSGAWAGLFAWIAAPATRWATPLLPLSLPLLWCSAVAQTGLMISTLIIAGFQCLDRRPRLAGALLAVATCIKPQALLLAPIVLWGRWETVKAAVVTASALCGASLLFGPRLWIEWLHNLPLFAQQVQTTVPKVSPAYLIGAPWWRALLAVAGIAFAWRERTLCGLLVGTLLCTPYTQLYDLAGLSYLGALLVAGARRSQAAVVVFGAALIVCVAWPIFTTAYCAGLAWLALAPGRRPSPALVTESISL